MSWNDGEKTIIKLVMRDMLICSHRFVLVSITIVTVISQTKDIAYAAVKILSKIEIADLSNLSYTRDPYYTQIETFYIQY